MATESFHAAYAAVAPSANPMSPSTGNLLRMFRSYQSNSVILKHYNYTGKLEGRYKEGLKPEAIAFLLICVIIVIENAIVLLAIWKNKKFHVPMYYLLGSLTLSDLLAGFTYMVNIVTSGAKTLNMTPVLWFLREGGVFIMLAASVISLLAIAIERHVTMVRMKPYQGDKQGRMFALIGASWVLSIFLGVLPVLGWNCIGLLDQCSTVLPLYAKSYILFCITVFSAILMSIVVLYVRIFRIVKCNTQRLATAPQRKGLYRKSQKYMALLKTVTIVLGVFIICGLLSGYRHVKLPAEPIIYTLTSKDMRRAILRLLCQPCLMTKDGQLKKIGMPFLECSTSKTDGVSHRLEGLETTVSSGNCTPSTIKAIYPRMSKT
ncbi:Sphingosine 1-phosphate receptor 1 [Dissostichus eleginoides]|uniref:Sphingosine 1-phosphate receptor 1 n=1 Tax=Dissostichus eleginoides TaxID=100907 RepID=A0AAD9ETR0_DISEL|nr:Sphingosine 1-phosphate receptor 1 [Dissostichus eleginoides]